MFRETIEDFLRSKNIDTTNRTVETYRRKIYVFYDFIVARRTIDASNYDLILCSIKKEDIIESIGFYVNKCGIKFKSTADNYFSVIKEYFKFIQNNHGISSKVFNDNNELLILKELVESKISELRLNEKQQCEPLAKEICIKLINACNEKINNVTDKQVIKGGYNSDYSFFVSAVILKIMLFTGIKINILTSLEVENFDINLNKLKINGFWIHLPDDLSNQLKRYIKIRKSILSDADCKRLFFNRNNLNKQPQNSKMLEVLNLVVGNKKSVAVSKYTIIEMIKSGVPAYVITEFTGYKDDVFEHCEEIASQEFAEFRDRDLDAKMRGLEIFDLL